MHTNDLAQSDRTMALEAETLDLQSPFIAKHLQRIFMQIYRVVRNVADAQDLTQETFIKALRHRDQLKDEQKAAHWLSRIAANAAIDFVRRTSRLSFTEIDETFRTHDDNPERLVMRAEAHTRLASSLRLLTPRERTALVLRDVEGLPAEEVASRMDCSKATVRSHIANARIKLRRYLQSAPRTGDRERCATSLPSVR